MVRLAGGCIVGLAEDLGSGIVLVRVVTKNGIDVLAGVDANT